MTVVDDFSQVSVLCVGDVMLDRFVNGNVRRISPESPVPVLSIAEAQACPGGAANVARNIASLGGRCTLLGVVGDDAAGDELERSLADIHRISSYFVRTRERPTTEKVRYVAQGQHLLRTDREVVTALSHSLADELLALIAAMMAGHQIMVLSDYAKGVLTDGVIRGAIAIAQAHGAKVIVDPKSAQIVRYAGATVVTPNARETEQATGIDPTDDDGAATRAGKCMLNDAAVNAVLITRAHRGMTLVPRNGAATHWPASGREVFDVVGAGDTVVATLALVLGAGGPLAEASRLANVAAGIVVGKRGTATVAPSELIQELTRLGHGHLAGLREKILSPQQAVSRIANWKRDGHAVGFTSGAFDILHVGHLSLLNFGREHCGRLVVGLLGDEAVRRRKGPRRPINAEADRAMVLAALEAVDAIVTLEGDTPLDVIRLLAPQVLVVGGVDSEDESSGADLVQVLGGRVLRCERTPTTSPSRLIETLL